jgi:Domain of unknown function (DUF3471)
MRQHTLITICLMLPSALAAQSSAAPESPNHIMFAFETFADVFGSRLVAAFDSISATQYDYRPTAQQQTIGYVAQHLEDANYGLCEQISDLKHARTGKDSLADTVKARWPKDTLVTRLKASLDFCFTAMQRVGQPQVPALTRTLLTFETDLAEHYSQISIYMRLLGMVPPSALPPTPHTVVELSASALSPYVGVYQLAPGLELDLTMRDGALFVRSSEGGAPVKLSPESGSIFWVREADARLTFTRDASGTVTGFVLHQYGRDRPARKIR